MLDDQLKAVSTKLKFPFKSEDDLEKLLASLESLFSICFREKGEARISFDIKEFPPKQMPTRGFSGPFLRAFYGSTGLKRFQKKQMKPRGEHSGTICYLTGEIISIPANELRKTLEDIRIYNPSYRIFSCSCEPENLDTYHGRFPSMFLDAARGDRAEIYFQILELLFKSDESKKTDYAERIMSMTARAFVNIYNGNTFGLPDIGRIIMKKDLVLPDELPHLKKR